VITQWRFHACEDVYGAGLSECDSLLLRLVQLLVRDVVD